MKFGKYQIINKIATGGMAEVFRAKITGEMGFEKLLVLKKVLPHLAAEDKWIMHFIDEAKLAALLHHENIIHIYDFGKIDNSWFLAMEYLSGKDLKGVITYGMTGNTPLGLENILHIISKICDGLDYAHQLKGLNGTPLNIVHRDISPQNICITFDGKVKIIDFGIARAAERSVHTQTGMIKGKLAYMSPEQASGKAIDHRSDIFAVGIILYELLTGKRMFQGEVAEVLLQVIQAEYEPAENLLEDCPPELFAILGKALAKNPDDRYQSAGEMYADIENFMYQSNLRSGSRKLAEYMTILFEEDYTNERYEIIETLDLTSAGDSIDEPDIVKTAVLERGNSEAGSLAEILPMISTKLKPLANVPAIVTDGIDRAVNTLKKSGGISGKNAITAFICLMIALSVTGGWQLKKSNEYKVAEMLTAAENSFKKGMLTEPPDESAYFYYQEALDVDGDNEEAQKGIQKIVRRKIELATMVLSRFRHDAALTYINSGLAIEPNNKELLELKTMAEKKVSNRLLGTFKSIFNPENNK